MCKETESRECLKGQLIMKVQKDDESYVTRVCWILDSGPTRVYSVTKLYISKGNKVVY